MRVQKSFDIECGTLYIVGTPIGNLGDFSFRGKETLEKVDVIAAEDTRHTRKLLSHFQISKPLLSYHKFNQKKQEEVLIRRLKEGESIALVSDAGMPTISDPGELLIHRAIKEEIVVVPIPGPIAALTALVASGLPSQPFLFLGFLPRVAKKRKEMLQTWSMVEATLILYEAPYRLLSMLEDVLLILGNREIVISREITKKNEEWVRGRIQECIYHLKEREIKGEVTIVISPCKKTKEEAGLSEEEIISEINDYITEGFTKKESIQKVAKKHTISKNDVYQKYHVYVNERKRRD